MRLKNGGYYKVNILDINDTEHEFQKVYDWTVKDNLLILFGNIINEPEQQIVMPMQNIIYMSSDEQKGA